MAVFAWRFGKYYIYRDSEHADSCAYNIELIKAKIVLELVDKIVVKLAVVIVILKIVKKGVKEMNIKLLMKIKYEND